MYAAQSQESYRPSQLFVAMHAAVCARMYGSMGTHTTPTHVRRIYSCLRTHIDAIYVSSYGVTRP